MVQLNLVPVFGAYNNTSTIWRKFFTEISVQMVKATGFFLEAREKTQGIKSGCQRKPGKMLKMSTEGGQQNKFILTS